MLGLPAENGVRVSVLCFVKDIRLASCEIRVKMIIPKQIQKNVLGFEKSDRR